MYLLVYDSLPHFIVDTTDVYYIINCEVIFKDRDYSIIKYKGEEYEVDNKYINEDYDLLLYYAMKRRNFQYVGSSTTRWIFENIYSKGIDKEYLDNLEFNKYSIYFGLILEELIYPERFI